MADVYEVVEAETAQEALSKSKYELGMECVIVELEAMPNSDGTWTIIPKVGVK